MTDEEKKWREHADPIIADPTPGTTDDGVVWVDAELTRLREENAALKRTIEMSAVLIKRYESGGGSLT